MNQAQGLPIYRRFSGGRMSRYVYRFVTLIAIMAVAAMTFMVTSNSAEAGKLPDTVALNVEEARINKTLSGAQEPFSQQIVRDSGLQTVVETFSTELSQKNSSTIRTFLVDSGRKLWRTTLDNAQGRNSAYAGDPYEDRGLYWARLIMRAQFKAWVTKTPEAEPQLNQLLGVFERSSRGLDDLEFTTTPGVKRVMISGFDPFFLDSRIDMINPSGASVLQLSGRILETQNGPVQVQAVVLPVTWSGFDSGIVEDAFGPQMQRDKGKAQMVMTLSQGRQDFDIERWAGVWRGGTIDNFNEGKNQGYLQEVPAASAWSQTQNSPQFIETTLPYETMQSLPTGPYQVNYNQEYCAAADQQRSTQNCDKGVPPTGSYALSGSGGAYLSNESMYRVNRLRIGLGLKDLPGGHLHIPIPKYGNTGETGSSPELKESRKNIAEQSRKLIELASGVIVVDPIPTPTPTPTPTPEPGPSPTATPKPNPAPAPGPKPTPTSSAAPSPNPTSSPTPRASDAATPTPMTLGKFRMNSDQSGLNSFPTKSPLALTGASGMVLLASTALLLTIGGLVLLLLKKRRRE